MTQFVVLGHSVSPMSRGLRGFSMFIFALGSLTTLSALWKCISWTVQYAVGGAQKAKDNAAEVLARRLHNEGQLYEKVFFFS